MIYIAIQCDKNHKPLLYKLPELNQQPYQTLKLYSYLRVVVMACIRFYSLLFWQWKCCTFCHFLMIEFDELMNLCVFTF